MFITFEGGEGAGKTTQIEILKNFLTSKGYDVVMTREPGGCENAEALRDVFVAQKGQHWDVRSQALLMFTARRLHVNEVIQPALDAGKIVLCDRFTDSTRVYQGIAGELGLNEIEDIKKISIGELEPDLTFIFDLDVQIGLERAGKREKAGDTFEDKEVSFHDALRQGYLEIAENYADRCVVLDASQSVENVSKQIKDEIDKRIS